MTPTTVVVAVWDHIQARDWAGLRGLLADDLVVEWPSSGERMTSADAFVDVQREYPEGWSIQVQQVGALGGHDGPGDVTVVSEVQVPHVDVGVFAAVSFWVVRDGLVRSAREYWVGCAAEEPPAWRLPHVERYDGRLAPLPSP
jgi:ketosteroid isomerase-like protein